jgi:hypothetical protein
LTLQQMHTNIPHFLLSWVVLNSNSNNNEKGENDYEDK